MIQMSIFIHVIYMVLVAVWLVSNADAAAGETFELFVDAQFGNDSASGNSTHNPVQSLHEIARILANASTLNQTIDQVIVHLAPGMYQPRANESSIVSLSLKVCAWRKKHVVERFQI